MLRVIKLSLVILNVVKLNAEVIKLSVVTLNVVILLALMLSVVAPTSLASKIWSISYQKGINVVKKLTILKYEKTRFNH
jgi:hypothetical protein